MRAARRVFWGLALLVGLAAAGLVHAETLQGMVVKVADGDTLTVLDEGKRQIKIRVAGIDAPEAKQPYGQRSKQFLGDLALNKHVTVTWYKVDRFGRMVGTVRYEGIDLGLELVKAGLAWHFKRYEGEQMTSERAAYAAAESAARQARRGLWREPNPEAPWDYRGRKH